jgi:hypothetical protein
MANPGPAIQNTVNTESPRSFFQFIQTISVSLTPTQIATASSVEQSYGANGATQATAATGLLPGDVILSISPPSTAASCSIGGYRVDTAVADKFYIDWVTSTTTITPPAGQYLITVGRVIQSVTTTPGTLASLPAAVVTAA